MENWKLLHDEGFESRYEVSDKGRIRSVPRITNRKDGRNRFVKGKILSQRRHPKGYMLINLKYGGKLTTFKVHRLVATEFILNPDELPEVNHKDEVKDNNNIENLEWCTHKYNSSYGTRGKRQGEKISKIQIGRKLSEETKRKIAEKAKGRKHTEEWKREHSKKMKELYARKKLIAI